MRIRKAYVTAALITLVASESVATESLLVCPRDLEGIETTPNAILEASGRDKIGFLHDGMGDPAEDSANWFRGIYDTFVTPEAQGRYFFQTQVWGFGQTFVADDSEFLFPICNLQGQCVQGHLQAEFESNWVDETVGLLGGIVGGLVDLAHDFEFTIASLTVGYTHPKTGKISREFAAVNGTLPAAEAATGGEPRNSDCLDNDGNITIRAEDRGDRPEDQEREEDEVILDAWWEEEEAYGGPTPETCGWSYGYDTLEGAITPRLTCL